ncbi:hypothetical protein KCP75_19520 [Salmonella enterica subsp. enterica]|nr:hypothetical protein KCP75_19520 [Salmonella enterica subsp. enterica]
MIIIGGFRSGLSRQRRQGAVAARPMLCRRIYRGINVFQSTTCWSMPPKRRQSSRSGGRGRYPRLILIAELPHDGVRFCCSRWSTLRDSYLSSL